MYVQTSEDKIHMAHTKPVPFSLLQDTDLPVSLAVVDQPEYCR